MAIMAQKQSKDPDTFNTDIERIKQFEYAKWHAYFEEAILGKGQEHETTLWWQASDQDSIEIVKSLFSSEQSIDLLEAACGSGGTSFKLAEYMTLSSLTLLDLSTNALNFAKILEPAHLNGKVTYTEGDITQLPFQDRIFHLTWNVGVIEHYPKPILLQIVKEMLRVTKREGYVLLGIPNRRSVAVLKAWFLGTDFGRKYLPFAKGYRFDTEILYGNHELKNFLEENLKLSVDVAYAGNCLWVGAPDMLVRLTQKYFKQSSCSFLTFFVLKLK
jgi:ubiquinone/menaquinone biosynthesis C-methylase UbiE